MILEQMLRRIRDGQASEDERAACAALVATDLRVPDDIRDGLFEDDPAGDAAGLLALFGADDLGLAPALQAELDAEMVFDPSALDLVWDVPLAQAVRFEAGTVALDDAVAATLGHPERLPLAEAVLASAGTVELWGGVAQAIGAELLPVAEAVRHHAGSVSLWPAVAEAVTPRVAANNNRWWWSGLVAAAAAAMLVVGWPAAPLDEAPLVFAGSAETRVEELIASEGVTVLQLEGDEGALILWIEDDVSGEVL